MGKLLTKQHICRLPGELPKYNGFLVPSPDNRIILGCSSRFTAVSGIHLPMVWKCPGLLTWFQRSVWVSLHSIRHIQRLLYCPPIHDNFARWASSNLYQTRLTGHCPSRWVLWFHVLCRLSRIRGLAESPSISEMKLIKKRKMRNGIKILSDGGQWVDRGRLRILIYWVAESRRFPLSKIRCSQCLELFGFH